MVTRKKNGAHGIGLESVQNIVEKYDGILDLEYENKKFVTSIILYL
ncbi:MAG: GHKL domain-containing protein [Eubacterium sp.]